MAILPRKEILVLFVAVMAGLAAGNRVGDLYGSSVLSILASAAAIVVVGTAGEYLVRRF
ncbi:MAG: hypothetical protein PWP08_385 [Methanofollis sp.]|nr:hypothetical protein [Methanofollis sp.]